MVPEIGVAVERLLHGQRARVDLLLNSEEHYHLAHHRLVQMVLHALRVGEHVLRLAGAEDLRLAPPPCHYDGRRRLLPQPRQGELRQGHLLRLGDALERCQRLEQLLLAARFAVATERRARLVKVAAAREARRTVRDAGVLAGEQALRQGRVGQNGNVSLLAEGDDLRVSSTPLCDGVLHNAVEEVVRELVGDDGRARVEDGLHVLATVVGDADGVHLSLLDELANDGHVHGGRNLVVRPVDLEDVDVVGLQVFEGALEDGAQALRLQVVAVHLGGDDVLIALSS